MLQILLPQKIPTAFHQRHRIDALHRLPKRTADLQQIRRSTEIRRLVRPRGVEQRRIEEYAIAPFQRQRDIVPLEEFAKLPPPAGEKPGLEELTEREQPGRPARARHVAVRDGALQRQELAREVRGPGEQRARLVFLEAQMVVAMGALRDTAGPDDVHLRRHAVTGAQPGGADEGEPRVGVVLHEGDGVLERVLAERVPDPVVGSARGEVVSFLLPRRLLLFPRDGPVERCGRGVE